MFSGEAFSWVATDADAHRRGDRRTGKRAETRTDSFVVGGHNRCLRRFECRAFIEGTVETALVTRAARGPARGLAGPTK